MPPMTSSLRSSAFHRAIEEVYEAATLPGLPPRITPIAVTHISPVYVNAGSTLRLPTMGREFEKLARDAAVPADRDPSHGG